jgi:DNA (cytosine-5)-methyltransferase 3A
MLAMQAAGIKVARYVAYEIDKYAVQTSSHNFPMIEHRGDVFHADFTQYSGFDFLVGGSPCTYWSIAQKNNRETEASGMGWELFSQYVRALREAQPMYFIYENNKSMSNAIRESITETFGFEPICINSALVSAQNRQRLYWVGRRNMNGTYSRVEVEQPEDRGILLRDVLDGIGARELTDRELDYMVRQSTGKYSDR